MFAEGSPELLQFGVQLGLVAVAELLASHLLSGGEEMEGIIETELVLLLQ